MFHTGVTMKDSAKTSRFQVPLLLAGLLLTLLVATVPLKPSSDGSPTDRQAALARRVMVAQKCGSCHTLKADGLQWSATIGPDLSLQGRRQRSNDWLLRHLSYPASIPDQELDQQFQGKQRLMPSFAHLSEKELKAVAAYLNSLR